MDQKPYRDLNTYYREIFGEKTAKISLDGGFTCPNRDGTLGKEGCIFCSAGGSGDFAENASLPILTQIEKGKSQTSKKWETPKYIAYFQAFTNTYAPVEILRQKYEEALSHPDIAGLSIATRPDCLGEDVLALLEEISQKTHLWIELGLQTANEKTAERICRGYKNEVFEKAVFDLSKRRIPIVVHVILGLPEETPEDMLETVDYINTLPVDGVKFHLMHVLEHTKLGDWYQAGKYTPMTKEAYISVLCRCIARLRPDIVIHRLTGDGDKKILLAPLWSAQKRDVLNSIHKYLGRWNITQGMDCKNR